MSVVTGFEMKIVDIFHFADGRTVFVGKVDRDTRYIRPCQCELLINGIPKAVIQIEGEMMPDGTSPEGLRSVSTRDPIAADKKSILDSDFRLKFT